MVSTPWPADYYGHVPNALESAALLFRLHAAPMYFYRKGKGRYKPAPADALKAALASVERKREQALLQARYVEQLVRFELPEEFKPRLAELLYKPDRNTIEVKAMEQAAGEVKLSTVHLLEKCGAIPSSRDYHVNRFLLDYFPRGAGFRPILATQRLQPICRWHRSRHSASTTRPRPRSTMPSRSERLPQGGWEIGVHIAAPALGIAVDSPARPRGRDAPVDRVHAGRQDHDAARRGRSSTTLWPRGASCPRCRSTWTLARISRCAERAARWSR